MGSFFRYIIIILDSVILSHIKTVSYYYIIHYPLEILQTNDLIRMLCSLTHQPRFSLYDMYTNMYDGELWISIVS